MNFLQISLLQAKLVKKNGSSKKISMKSTRLDDFFIFWTFFSSPQRWLVLKYNFSKIFS